MKAVLEEHGRTEEKIGSPRGIIKLAYQCKMVSDCEGWLGLLEARNILAHTYSEEQSIVVISDLKGEYIELFRKLKAELEENWLVL
jgi:nucleotidyltransferase substrate binding protein (TIGR01987 family)